MSKNDFNEQTELFYKETGIWPPGRNMPSAMCGGEDIYQTRMRAYDYWRKTHKLQAEVKRLKENTGIALQATKKAQGLVYDTIHPMPKAAISSCLVRIEQALKGN